MSQDEPKIGHEGWKPRWQKIAEWRKAHGGVSGGKGAKRRQGRGLASRRAYGNR